MNLRAIIIVFACLINQSCAAYYTHTRNTALLEDEACAVNCALPRMYSGVVMDFCGFIGNPTGQGGGIMFFDMFGSIIADTAMLPFTIYEQLQYGNYSSKDKCKNTIE